jgi:hypothetical protein
VSCAKLDRLFRRRTRLCARGEPLQPDLVKVRHPVWKDVAPQARHPAVLGFFCEHMRARARGGDQPRMVGIHTQAMCIPGDALARHAFDHGGANADPKGAPREVRAQGQIGIQALVDSYVVRVWIPRGPPGGPKQPRPDHFGRGRGFDLVADVDRCLARRVPLRPMDGFLHATYFTGWHARGISGRTPCGPRHEWPPRLSMTTPPTMQARPKALMPPICSP